MFHIKLTRFEAQLLCKVLGWRSWLPLLSRIEDGTAKLLLKRLIDMGALCEEPEEDLVDASLVESAASAVEPTAPPAPPPVVQLRRPWPAVRHQCDHKKCKRTDPHQCHFNYCYRCRRARAQLALQGA